MKSQNEVLLSVNKQLNSELQAKNDRITEMQRKCDDAQRAFDQAHVDNQRLTKNIQQLNKSLKVF